MDLYKDHYGKYFTQSMGEKFFDCSIYDENGHFKCECPSEQTRHKKINWRFDTNSRPNKKGPKFIWVPKKMGESFFIASDPKEKKWYLDSGCSRHMTVDSIRFENLTQIDKGNFTF